MTLQSISDRLKKLELWREQTFSDRKTQLKHSEAYQQNLQKAWTKDWEESTKKVRQDVDRATQEQKLFTQKLVESLQTYMKQFVQEATHTVKDGFDSRLKDMEIWIEKCHNHFSEQRTKLA